MSVSHVMTPLTKQVIVSRLDEISTPRKDRSVSGSEHDLATTPRGGYTPTRAPTTPQTGTLTPRTAAGGVGEMVQTQSRTLHAHGHSASPAGGGYMTDLLSSQSSTSHSDAPKSPHHTGVAMHNGRGAGGAAGMVGGPKEYRETLGGGGGGEGERGPSATVLDGLRGVSTSRALPALPPARPHSQSPLHSVSSGATTPNGSRINPNSPGT